MVEQNSASLAAQLKTDWMFKVVVLGDCSVGKTSIIRNYICHEVSMKYQPTIGSDMYKKVVKIPHADDIKDVTLQIWDTGGQEKMQALSRTFYRGAQACILVYDITNGESFKNLQKWKKNFLDNLQPDDPQTFPFFLFGNKKDLVDKDPEARIIPLQQVNDWISVKHDIEGGEGVR